MTGVRYEHIFSYSEYPADEPTLPANVHIQRSLGGFAVAVALFASVLALWGRVRRATHWFPRWLYGFVLLDALILLIGGLMSDLMFVIEKGWIEKEPDERSEQP